MIEGTVSVELFKLFVHIFAKTCKLILNVQNQIKGYQDILDCFLLIKYYNFFAILMKLTLVSSQGRMPSTPSVLNQYI